MAAGIEPGFRGWLGTLRIAAEASKALSDELGALMLEDDDSDAFIRRLIRLSEQAEAAADEVANLVHIGVGIGAFDWIARLAQADAMQSAEAAS
ncbi:hypothetical protein [Rhodovulum strictum]|uniref:Uncharacterized protein n=1 Tax=Rhodovulum strictum TaxID=58314 RepID=A0A844BDV9_9RHOB|nr:hypothetical protein [Rhodovulum strictum]MRH22684.1 hypothetical protein [Rhodovulum strictum]